MTSQYPEHDKLRPLQEQSQTCGEFLAWLNETKGWFLATFDEEQEECRNCGHPDRHTLTSGGGAWGRCTYENDEGKECGCTSGDFGCSDRMYQPSYTIDRLLAEFFGIDAKELEAEKQRMLDEMREAATYGQKS